MLFTHAWVSALFNVFIDASDIAKVGLMGSVKRAKYMLNIGNSFFVVNVFFMTSPIFIEGKLDHRILFIRCKLINK